LKPVLPGINKFLDLGEHTGGKERFAVLESENDEIMLCLHKMEEHNHPTMMHPGTTPGNGLMLYFRTENMHTILQNTEKLGCAIEEDVHLNPNSLKKEFSLIDLDGYYFT
jgi:hypothetical protein